MTGQPVPFKRRPVWPPFIFVTDQSRSPDDTNIFDRVKIVLVNRRIESILLNLPLNTNRPADRPVKFVNLLKFKKIFDKYIMLTK